MGKDDPYLLPDANVLSNCFGEKNDSILQEYEIFFSGLRICELIDNPITSFPDYNDLKNIHAYIFQDIYPDWAGQTRTVKISKREKLLKGKSVKYTHPGDDGSRIEDSATQLFQKLRKEEYLHGLTRPKFCENFTKFMSQLWQIHPFREGNTRTIMVLCYYISSQAGYPLSLNYIDRNHKELRDGLVLSTVDKPQRLAQFLCKAITRKSRHGIEFWKHALRRRILPTKENR